MAANDGFHAFCRYCKRSISIQAGKHDLIKHFNTAKHQKNSKKVIYPDVAEYAKKISSLFQKINSGLENYDPNLEGDVRPSKIY